MKPARKPNDTAAAQPSRPEFSIQEMAPLILVAIAIVATALYFPNQGLVDEIPHWHLAQLYAQGQWASDTGLAPWPTTNALIGWIVALLGQQDHIVAGRLIVAAFALFGAAGFYKLAQQFDRGTASLRTAQFFLAPVVLPFCALVYTDIPALSFLMWSALGAVRRQPWLMLGCGMLACAFRQNQIIWFIALALVVGWLAIRAGDRIQPVHAAAAGAVLAGWAAIVWWLHRISAGALAQTDNTGELKGIPNIWFALAVAGLVFLPYFLYRLAKDREGLALWRYAALALLVVLTFHVTSQLNKNLPNYFVHNYLLLQADSIPGMAVFVISASVMAVLFFRTRLGALDQLRLPFLLFGALSLLPHWVIEQRYYLPIYALFWTMRAPVDRRVEYTQLAFSAACSAWMVANIARIAHFV